MKLFKTKCFVVNLWREIYQLCLTWIYITHNLNIFIIRIKVLLGNNLNDFCLETFCFLVFKYFLFKVCFSLNEGSEIFNWGSSFWLTLFWGCSLELLSIIIIPVSWGAVFDLEVPSWLLLDTKLIFPFSFPVLIFSPCIAWKPFQNSIQFNSNPGHYF